jgi:hypothetical protein
MNTSLLKFDRLRSSSIHSGTSLHPVSSPASSSTSHPPHSGGLRHPPTT